MTYQVECRDLWKIYGERAEEAFAAIGQRGLDKDQVRQEFQCVVGVVGASFTISQGEIFCIMGLSGSGKSTLVRHINRLIEPTAGEVVVNGQPISKLDQKGLRRLRSETIGMVFQHMALWPHRTIRDNVAFGLEIRHMGKPARYEAAERALEMVQLDGWDTHYPDELSGGMQQRVGLARALAADPDILLMDEPFSALDPLIRRQLQDQFLELSAVMKKTTIFITHDLDEAIRLGHRIAIMNEGVIVQIGTPEEIVTNPKDDYVAAFVKGISRVNIVCASGIMTPINGAQPTEKRVKADAGLGDILDHFITNHETVTVVDEEGSPVGLVTLEAALRVVRGT